jgi:crotonobetainyl-CoA:carnitine CoA-transferase CaiB-like acyl-CoA transferase
MVDAHVGDTFAQLTRDECAARLREADIAYGFVNEVADLARHPALRRLPVATPGGSVEVAAPAARFSDGERDFGPVPALGQHTEQIRAEFGG